ncbi:MAG: phosphatase PAP2 family protein [Rhodanobacter sp.]
MLLVGGGVALSKVLYMVSGWHPAGWNFIGLSGHAALSFLFWPCAGALVTARNRTWLRIAMIGLGAGLALAISVSSWILRDHSLSEVVAGALWGAAVATAFLVLTWRQVPEAPLIRKWMIASLLLLAFFAFGHEFPSERVLGRIALLVSGPTSLHTRTSLGRQAQLTRKPAEGRQEDSPAARTRHPATP